MVAMPTGGQAFDFENGRRLFEEHCARCHGVDGRPMLPQTPDFQTGDTLNKSDPELIEGVRRGVGVMPGFENTIGTRDMIDVMVYLRTLQR